MLLLQGDGIRPGRGRPPRRGLHRLVRHLDDARRSGASELHAHVDEPHDVGRGERAWPRSGSARPRPARRRASSPRPSRRATATPSTRPTRSTSRRSTTGRPRRRTARTTTRPPPARRRRTGSRRGPRCASRTDARRCGIRRAPRIPGEPFNVRGSDMTTTTAPPQHDRPRREPAPPARGVAVPASAAPARAAAPAPLGWLVLVYLGSLFILLLSAFWAHDTFTGNVEPFAWSLDAFEIALSRRGLPDRRGPDARDGGAW